MPFGHQCEHENFDACVRTMTGKVEDPKGYCASLMRATEEHCRRKAQGTGPSLSDLLKQKKPKR